MFRCEGFIFSSHRELERSGKILKLGVTGGIGSGKTTVCRVFNVLGVPVFSADSIAREIMDSDITVRKRVNDITGRDMYTGGKLDRETLAGLIFHDRRLLEEINRAVHPAVREKFMAWSEEQDFHYVILEAAIMFESGSWQLVDRTLTVIAPLEERIERVIRRNQLSREQVVDRIRNQSDDNYKISRSDYVINNADNQMILPAVLKIHNEILSLIKN